jgi:2-phospho-L-lactate guanylyltransferase
MIWAVIPAKDYARAKSRLAPMLDLQDRRDLARELFLHVASTASEVVDRVAVLTDSAEVAADAHALGALVLPDRRQALGPLVDDGLAALSGDRALVLMGDLPLLDADALRRLLQKDAAVVPDRHRLGTNALLTPLPSGPTCFGNIDSFVRHSASYAEHTCDRMAWDIDLPEDVKAIDWRACPRPFKVAAIAAPFATPFPTSTPSPSAATATPAGD